MDISILLFGRFRVVRDRDVAVHIELRKAQALLAYLAMEHETPQPRDVLASLLWPESSSQLAHANLRQTLRQLRRVFVNGNAHQPLLVCSPQEVQLSVTTSLWVDAKAFDALLDGYRFDPHKTADGGTADMERMQQAVALYRGQFLAGLALPDSTEYQEWVTLKQEEYHNKALNALAYLADHYEQVGQYQLADQFVLRQLQLEPWREDAHRRRMSILAMNGNRTAAILQFEQCRRILDTELGIVPAPETMALYERIRGGAGGPPAVTEPQVRTGSPVITVHPPPAIPAAHPLFVGREQELDIFAECLAACYAGDSRVVIVSGERGSGKSALIEHFLDHAVHGRHLLQIVRGQMDGWPAPVGQTDQPPGPTGDRQPLLLICEDLQRFDSEVHKLLRPIYVGRSDAPYMAILSYRPGEIIGVQRHPVELALNEVRSRFDVAEIDLDGSDGFAWINAYCDAQPGEFSEEFRRALYRYTLGHPQFTIEVLKALQRRPASGAGAYNCKSLASGEFDWGPLPPRVKGIVQDLVTTLSLEQVCLLEAGAVQGEKFLAQVVAEMQGAPAEQIIANLSGHNSPMQRFVAAHDILTANGRTLAVYRFRNPIYYRQLYEGLDSVNRARLHAAAAAALEELYSGNRTAIIELLAHHYAAAGAWEKASACYYEMGAVAVRGTNYKRALQDLETGLELLKKLDQNSTRDTLELKFHLELAVPIVFLHGWGGAAHRQCCERADELARQTGDPAMRGRALFLLGSTLQAQGNYVDSFGVVEELTALAHDTKDMSMVGLSEGALGQLCFFRGDLLSARRHLLHVAGDTGDRYRVLREITGVDFATVCNTWLGWTLWTIGCPDQAQEYFHAAFHCAGDHALSRAFVAAFIDGAWGVLCHRWELVFQAVEVLSTVCNRDHVTLMDPWLSTLAGRLWCEQGDHERGIAAIRRGAADWSATGTVPGQPLQALILADAYAHNLCIAEALQVLDEALTLVQHCGQVWSLAELYRLRGATLLRALDISGDAKGPLSDPVTAAAQAEVALRMAVEVAHMQQAKFWELRAAIDLFRLLRRRKEHKEGRRMLGAVYDTFSEGYDLPDLQTARMLLSSD